MAYSLYKMNKGLDFFEELMRASFQYSSNKIKHPSIRDNSFYSINSCSFLNFQRSQRFDFVFLSHDSAKFKQVWLCSRCSLGPASHLKIFNFQFSIFNLLNDGIFRKGVGSR